MTRIRRGDYLDDFGLVPWRVVGGSKQTFVLQRYAGIDQFGKEGRPEERVFKSWELESMRVLTDEEVGIFERSYSRRIVTPHVRRAELQMHLKPAQRSKGVKEKAAR